MSPANMDGPWRDANIIPRYNAAGVAKFAFHMPEGMPMIGKPPAPEGPGRFLTGYFGRRHDALDWLATSRCAKQRDARWEVREQASNALRAKADSPLIYCALASAGSVRIQERWSATE